MPTNHPIQIVSGNPTTQQLILNPSTPVEVVEGDQITWSIISGSNVKRFRIKKKKIYFPEWLMFSKSPSEHEGIGDSIETRKLPNPVAVDYNYSIFWRDDTNSGGRPYEHDPKITIMPSPDLHFARKSIGLIICTVGILSIAFLLTRTKKKCF